MQKPKQMIVPIYQRKYSWTVQQCNSLWKDIERVIENPHINSHFIGSVVYIDDEGSNIADIAKFLLIDGQQRLTTTTILLFALGQAFKEDVGDEKSQRKINNYYLFNNEEEGNARYKLLSTDADKDTLLNLLEDTELPAEYSSRIMENYNFFVQQIKRSEHSPDEILEGMKKLVIVDTSLQRGTDDPQLIFESLNSTGLDLSQVDLIRNYILMGLDRNTQNDIYNRYWRKMEVGFEKSDNKELFDKFFRDYLIIKTGAIPRKDEIYQVFKKYVIEHREVEVETLVDDIYQYAKIFFKVAFQEVEDKDIRMSLVDLAELDMDVVYPFLLDVYADYENRKIIKTELVETIRMIESYIFRRSICEVPTHGLNKIFASLKKDIKEDNYLESVKAAFLLRESYRVFPRDEVFIKSLLSKDVYHFRNCKYLLRKIENHNRKEFVNVNEYSIEHVVPQNENMSAGWKNELGGNWAEVHENYLHTLGNITLTGYNSEMSDSLYRVKKVYFDESPLKLNKTLQQAPVWNEAAILKRATELAILSAEHIWKIPHLDDAVLEKYKPVKNPDNGAYDVDFHYERMSENTKAIYHELRDRVLALDSGLSEKFNKYHIAIKYTNVFQNFVDIKGRKNKLKVYLNVRYEDLNDTKRICRNASTNASNNLNAELELTSITEVNDLMDLIQQQYNLLE